MSDYKHLTVFPGEDRPILQDAARVTGLSINQIIVQSVHARVKVIVSDHHAREGRLTNVEPLPENVMDRLYRQRDDNPDGIEALMEAQAIHSEE